MGFLRKLFNLFRKDSQKVDGPGQAQPDKDEGTRPEIGKADADAGALAVASGVGDVRVAQTLISQGADINRVAPHGFSALMSASVNGRSKMVEWLIDHGAQVNVRNQDGVTPLMIAAYGGHADTIRRLRARKATVHLQDCEGTTAYEFAAQNGHNHCLDLLKF